MFILDSLDQLTPNDYKNVEKWIFPNLPDSVKLIVSTIPEHGNLLDMITKIIRKKQSNQLKFEYNITESNPLFETKIKDKADFQLLYVTELTPIQSETILNKWLLDVNHKLTEDQWNDLRYIFKNGKLLPLFLKLIYDIVINWRSYDKASDELLKCLKIDDIIIHLFHRMEAIHGSVIFRRAICYMTVCKNGIGDIELEDILSLDDDVLYSVFQFHMPPIRRLPTILWIRIKNDLKEYIVEKEANDSKVIYWYHRRFVEVALNQYVKSLNKAENEIIFQNILDFYNETWKDKEKPFELNAYLKKKLQNNLQNVADRHLSSQPIRYVGEDGVIRYNKRKLTELPNCLANISSSFGLKKACELVFYNYEFMLSKFTCESLNEVLEDLQRIISETQSWGYQNESQITFLQLKLFLKLMNICGPRIDDYPNSYGFQITSRLLNYYGRLNFVTKLIDQCDRTSPNECAFISPHVQQEHPGSFLIGNLQKHNLPVLKFLFLKRYFITYSSFKIIISKFEKNPVPRYLFDVLLPTQFKLKQYLSVQRNNRFNYDLENSKQNLKEVIEEGQVGFKCILEPIFFQLSQSADLDDSENNPDLFPVIFLIAKKHYAYVITSNQQLRFVYESDQKLGQEILDVFCLGFRQIIIVEKNTSK